MIVPNQDESELMIFVTHDVWFRSFRDKLSLSAKYSNNRQESHLRFRGKIDRNVYLREVTDLTDIMMRRALIKRLFRSGSRGTGRVIGLLA